MILMCDKASFAFRHELTMKANLRWTDKEAVFSINENRHAVEHNLNYKNSKAQSSIDTRWLVSEKQLFILTLSSHADVLRLVMRSSARSWRETRDKPKNVFVGGYIDPW